MIMSEENKNEAEVNAQAEKMAEEAARTLRVNKALNTTWAKALIKMVESGKGIAWGNAQSAGMIEAMVDLLLNNEDVALEGYDAIEPYILRVVNPSAFAQALEEASVKYLKTKGEKAPFHLERPKRGKSETGGGPDFFGV